VALLICSYWQFTVLLFRASS